MVKKKILIYIGRSLKGLPRNTIFSGDDFPLHVAQLIRKYPNIRKLMVQPENLQQAKKDVKTNGHILNFYAKHLLDEIGEN